MEGLGVHLISSDPGRLSVTARHTRTHGVPPGIFAFAAGVLVTCRLARLALEGAKAARMALANRGAAPILAEAHAAAIPPGSSGRV